MAMKGRKGKRNQKKVILWPRSKPKTRQASKQERDTGALGNAQDILQSRALRAGKVERDDFFRASSVGKREKGVTGGEGNGKNRKSITKLNERINWTSFE